MSPAVLAVLSSWSLPVPATSALVLTALVYFCGWVRLRSALPNLIPGWRLAAFLSGVLSLWIAVGSPLEAYDDELLSIHMVQHLILMAVAPPLILLGAPALPLLHGLPQFFVRGTLGPLLRWPLAQWLGRTLTQPAIFLGMLANDAVSAFLAFYDRVLYPSYASTPRPFDVAPLDDQAIAGALMWVFGTFVYLLPAIVITLRALSPLPTRWGGDDARKNCAGQAKGAAPIEAV